MAFFSSQSMQTISTPDLDQQQGLHLLASYSSEPTTSTRSHSPKRARSESDIARSPRSLRRFSTPIFCPKALVDAGTWDCVQDELVPLLFSSQPSTNLVTEYKNLLPQIKKRRLLPLPLTSSPARYESIYLDSTALPEPNLGAKNQISKQDYVRHSAQCKRRRSGSAEDLLAPDHLRRSSRSAIEVLKTVIAPRSPSQEQEDLIPEEPIQHWARTGRWPENFSTMSKERSGSPKKRLASSSYTQQVKDGEVPLAYSPAYEKHLATNRIYMEEARGRTLIREESKTLCQSLLDKDYPDPTSTAYPLSDFLSVWQRAQNRNERRIFRDITPLLVPSAEVLAVTGYPRLEYVAEEIDVEWTKCSTLAGPMPKPDLAFGLSPSVFNEEEMAKLQNYTTFDRPTRFTDNMYFPFLLCEVKCTDQGINRADRQNMHSASMAVNALAQFLRSADPATSLDGEVLAISISHDNERAKLYGHFTVAEGGKDTFYRYPIQSFTFNFVSRGWKSINNFARASYETLYTSHLARIRAALAKMEDPRSLAKISTMSIGENDDRDSSQRLGWAQDPSVLSSQETSLFKVPSEPARKRQKGTLALLQEQLAEQQKQMAEQQRLNREQMALLQRQLAEQQKQMAEQAEQYKDQIKLLNRLLERS